MPVSEPARRWTPGVARGARDRDVPGRRSGDRRVHGGRGPGRAIVGNQPSNAGTGRCSTRRLTPGPGCRGLGPRIGRPGFGYIRPRRLAPASAGPARLSLPLEQVPIVPSRYSQTQMTETPPGGRMRQRPEPCSSARCWFAPRRGTGSARSWALRSRSDSPGCSWGSSWGLPLSTLAIDGSSSESSEGRAGTLALRYADLVLLALALPVFIVAGLAAARLRGRRRGVARAARNRVRGQATRDRSLASGERRTALGTMAAATLGRVWLITLAVLLVGLSSNARQGSRPRFSASPCSPLYMAAKVLDRLLYPERSEAMRTRNKVLIGVRRLLLVVDPARGPLRQRRQERRVPAPERVQADAWITIKVFGIDLSHQPGGPLPGPRRPC